MVPSTGDRTSSRRNPITEQGQRFLGLAQVGRDRLEFLFAFVLPARLEFADGIVGFKYGAFCLAKPKPRLPQRPPQACDFPLCFEEHDSRADALGIEILPDLRLFGDRGDLLLEALGLCAETLDIQTPLIEAIEQNALFVGIALPRGFQESGLVAGHFGVFLGERLERFQEATNLGAQAHRPLHAGFLGASRAGRGPRCSPHH